MASCTKCIKTRYKQVGHIFERIVIFYHVVLSIIPFIIKIDLTLFCTKFSLCAFDLISHLLNNSPTQKKIVGQPRCLIGLPESLLSLLSSLLELSLLLLLLLELLTDFPRFFFFPPILGTAAATFGALFKCVRRSSVRPPRPIEVKKLIANLNKNWFYQEKSFPKK